MKELILEVNLHGRDKPARYVFFVSKERLFPVWGVWWLLGKKLFVCFRFVKKSVRH
ncbi:MAG: hypothetical protein LBN40_01070 [Oscillospiraceae bacterium]|nr:hypothetical protein [Oscillospiraceae bacterium]